MARMDNGHVLVNELYKCTVYTVQYSHSRVLFTRMITMNPVYDCMNFIYVSKIMRGNLYLRNHDWGIRAECKLTFPGMDSVSGLENRAAGGPGKIYISEDH